MKTLFVASAFTAAMIAGSASAQVVGGQVGGQVGVGLPTGAVTDTVGSAVQGAQDMTGDTLRDTQDAVRNADPSVEADVDASVDADASMDPGSADVGAAIQTGAMVHGSDGGMVGSVTDVTRDAAGRATAFTLRSADGATRTVPAASVNLTGGVLVMPN